MEKKIKITYFEYGTIKAKIVNIYNWYDLPSVFANYGIIDNSIIKIERIIEASEYETEDTTNF